MKKPLAPDTEQVNRIFTSRIIILGLLMFLGLIALIARYGYLQVYAHDKYTTQADNNRIKLISAPPSRGYIYDRNGVILADNQPVFTAMLSPDEVEDPERTLNLLAPIFDLTDENITDILARLSKTKNDPVTIKIDLTEAQLAQFSERQPFFVASVFRVSSRALILMMSCLPMLLVMLAVLTTKSPSKSIKIAMRVPTSSVRLVSRIFMKIFCSDSRVINR